MPNIILQIKMCAKLPSDYNILYRNNFIYKNVNIFL